jgi:hypothetical protein
VLPTTLPTKGLLPVKPIDEDQAETLKNCGLDPLGPWDVGQLAALSTDDLATLQSLNLSPIITMQATILIALSAMMVAPSDPLTDEQQLCLQSMNLTEADLTNATVLAGLNSSQLGALQAIGLMMQGDLPSDADRRIALRTRMIAPTHALDATQSQTLVTMVRVHADAVILLFDDVIESGV